MKIQPTVTVQGNGRGQGYAVTCSQCGTFDFVSYRKGARTRETARAIAGIHRDKHAAREI